MEGSNQLIIAGSLNFIAAALHIGIIFGGPDWYRFFGAGEAMAQAAESGDWMPTLITLGIASVLALWGFYALSGAGVITPLPLLKVALVLITGVYLLRGVAGFILPFVSQHPAITQNSVTFWMVSSAVCCLFGVFHLLGLLSRWKVL